MPGKNIHMEKIIKRVGIVILLGILCFQTTFAQENYISGEIIIQKGDTLSGFIDYRNWKKNPDKIRFKEEPDQKSIVYTPTDITAFHVEDEIYISGIVNSEISPHKTDKLHEDPTIHTEIDTTFLQTLFKGDKHLYHYKAPGGKDNFYIEQDSNLELLIYKRYVKAQRNKYGIAKNKKYLRQLAGYLNDCPSIHSQLENTEYKRKSLEKLYEYYYECSQSDIVFQKKREKISTEIGALAGMSLSSLAFNSSFKTVLKDVDWKKSANFSAGMFFDVILPRNQGKWSINNELMFTSYNVSGQFEENFDNEDDYSIGTIEMGFSYLKLNNMVRYTYPVKTTYLYLNGGISQGIAISKTNYKETEKKFYGPVTKEEGKALNDTREYEQGYLIGLGTKGQEFSFEIRFERGNGMSEYSTLSSPTTRYYFLIGYKF